MVTNTPFQPTPLLVTALLLTVLLLSAALPTRQLYAADPTGATTTKNTSVADLLWRAEGPKAARKAVRRIEKLDLGFPQLYDQLSRGPAYSSEVATGRRVISRSGGFHCVIWVPETYDPQRRYPVRVYLHGGVSRPAPDRREQWWRNEQAVRSEDHLVVLPASWDQAMWWHRNQVENLETILKNLSSEYNFDENRVHLIGVSDGATGAWFHAFRRPMRWASIVSLIGHPKVLTNHSLDIDGELFVANLRNRPFFVANGGRDPLYPASSILPYLQLFHGDGVEIDFRPQPEGGHDLRFWPSEAEAIETFMRLHPRDPLPDELVWETEDAERYGRHHWLEITALGATRTDVELADANRIQPLAPQPVLGMKPAEDSADIDGVTVAEVQAESVAKASGLRAEDVIFRIEDRDTPTVSQLATVLSETTDFNGSVRCFVRRQGQTHELTLKFPQAPPTPAPFTAFPRKQPSGRVELARDGNLIVAQTRGVRAFRLLLAPAELDFDQPVRIEVNGIEVLSRRVELDTEVLLNRAAEDRDRSQLYGAELEIQVPNGI